MDKLNIALIGCGRIAKNHIEAIAINQDIYNLTALSDIVPERMEEKAAQYQARTHTAPKLFRDYQELLQDSSIHAVTIATESGYHARHVLDALEAGKHVIVEKPMALSIQDCDAMIALAKEKNLKLAVSHQNRYNPAIQQLRKAVEGGRFGRIINGTAAIRWNRNQNYYAQAPWRGTWALDGGTLMNQCLHNIDLLQWMLGEDAATVYCQASTFLRDIEGEDFGAIIVRFKSGSIGIIEGSACVYPTNLEETLSVFGETGTAVIGGLAVNKISQWRFPNSEAELEEVQRASQPDPANVYGNGHNPLFRDFYQAVTQDKTPYIDGNAGKKVVELILAAYKSRKEQLPVHLPLTNFSTLDMEAK